MPWICLQESCSRAYLEVGRACPLQEGVLPEGGEGVSTTGEVPNSREMMLRR